MSYHYRGHFIYAFPSATPIEPIPFSTRRGISFVGVAKHCAPTYDPSASDLVPESSISALERARVHEQENRKQAEDAEKQEQTEPSKDGQNEAGEENEGTNNTNADTVDKMSRPNRSDRSQYHSRTARPAHSQADSREIPSTSIAPLATAHGAAPSQNNVPRIVTAQAPSMPSVSAYAQQPTSGGYRFTPHDRAQYLATSAPGSRLASRHASVDQTPLGSRAVSPFPYEVRDYGSVYPVASTSRFSQYVEIEPHQRGAFSPVYEGSEDGSEAIWRDGEGFLGTGAVEWMDPNDVDAFVRTVSRPTSRLEQQPASAHQRHCHESTFLAGLGQRAMERSVSNERPPASPAYNTYDTGLYSGDAHHGRNQSAYTPTTPRPTPHAYQDFCLHDKGTHYRNTSADSAFFPPLDDNHNPYSNYASNYASYRPSAPGPTLRSRSRAASQVLNSAYNATHPPNGPRPSGYTANVPDNASNDTAADPDADDGPKYRCSIHDERCDGVTTTELGVTERARQSRGFIDCFPTIETVEKPMVDWYSITKEESKKMCRE